MRDFSNRQTGFTLFELLAASALLSAGFFIMITAMGQSLHTLSKSNQRTQMAMLAKSLIESEARGFQEIGRRQGQVGGVEWQLNTRQDASGAGVSLYRLELVMRVGEQEERITTLRIQNDGLEPYR